MSQNTSSNEFNFPLDFSEDYLKNKVDNTSTNDIYRNDNRSVRRSDSKSRSFSISPLKKAFSDSISFVKNSSPISISFGSRHGSSTQRVGSSSTKILQPRNTFILEDYYVWKDPIGSGSFSEVYKGCHKNTKQIVAVKAIRAMDQKNIDRIMTEINIMRSLDHKYIVKLYDVIHMQNEKKIYIIMEYCGSGTLEKYMHADNLLGECTVRKYFKCIRSGLKYLRSKDILHRDIKPHNILLTENNIAKISDFGLSITLENDRLTNTLCGSPIYMAPEVLLDNIYGVKTDLWSVGVMLYQLIYGFHPFSFKNMHELMHEIKDHNIIFPPSRISKQCVDLISKLLIVNSDSRISWTDFFNHKWFQIADQDMIDSPFGMSPASPSTIITGSDDNQMVSVIVDDYIASANFIKAPSIRIFDSKSTASPINVSKPIAIPSPVHSPKITISPKIINHVPNESAFIPINNKDFDEKSNINIEFEDYIPSQENKLPEKNDNFPMLPNPINKTNSVDIINNNPNDTEIVPKINNDIQSIHKSDYNDSTTEADTISNNSVKPDTSFEMTIDNSAIPSVHTIVEFVKLSYNFFFNHKHDSI